MPHKDHNNLFSLDYKSCSCIISRILFYCLDAYNIYIIINLSCSQKTVFSNLARSSAMRLCDTNLADSVATLRRLYKKIYHSEMYLLCTAS